MRLDRLTNSTREALVAAQQTAQSAGNPDLVPQRAWEFLAMAEHPILGDGVAKVELGYQLISMVQDRVPTPEGFDVSTDANRLSEIEVSVPTNAESPHEVRLSGTASAIRLN